MINNKGFRIVLSVFCLGLIFSCNSNSESSSKDNSKQDSTVKNVSDEKKSALNDSSVNKKEIVKDEKVQNNDASILSKEEDGIKLVKATSQKWAGGARGSGTGTYYCFTFIASLPSNKLNIDEVWIGQKFFNAIQSSSPIFNKPDFKANDSVFIKVNDLIPGELNRNIYSQDSVKKFNTPPPMKYDGAALIGYLENNKRKYFVINSFKELPRLNYP
jgi:hypothetical protein